MALLQMQQRPQAGIGTNQAGELIQAAPPAAGPDNSAMMAALLADRTGEAVVQPIKIPKTKPGLSDADKQDLYELDVMDEKGFSEKGGYDASAGQGDTGDSLFSDGANKDFKSKKVKLSDTKGSAWSRLFG